MESCNVPLVPIAARLAGFRSRRRCRRGSDLRERPSRHPVHRLLALPPQAFISSDGSGRIALGEMEKTQRGEGPR